MALELELLLFTVRYFTALNNVEGKIFSLVIPFDVLQEITSFEGFFLVLSVVDKSAPVLGATSYFTKEKRKKKCAAETFVRFLFLLLT